MELRILCMLGKYSTNCITSPDPNEDFNKGVHQSNSLLPGTAFLCTVRHFQRESMLSNVCAFFPALWALCAFTHFLILKHVSSLCTYIHVQVLWQDLKFYPLKLWHALFTLLEIGLCGEGDSLGIPSKMSCPQWCRNLSVNTWKPVKMRLNLQNKLCQTNWILDK